MAKHVRKETVLPLERNVQTVESITILPQCADKQRKRTKYRSARNIRQVENDSDNTDSESNSEFEIMMLTNGQNKSKIFATMLLINAQKTLQFQLDSGATSNLIPKRYVPRHILPLKGNKHFEHV